MSQTITIQIRATDLEVDRAINAYIPILECSYQLARGLPFSLPDGYEEIGRVSAGAGDVGRMARTGDAPEARPEARALAAAITHPDLFGFIVREVATGAIIVSIRGTLVPEEWLRNFTAIPADYSFCRSSAPSTSVSASSTPAFARASSRALRRSPQTRASPCSATAWAARWPRLRGRTSSAT